MSSTPGCRVDGQQGVHLDEAVVVSEEDLDRDEFEILGVAIEVGPELYGLGHEKPECEDGESVEIGWLVLVFLSCLEGFLEEISQGTIHDQSWWVEGRKMESVS